MITYTDEEIEAIRLQDAKFVDLPISEMMEHEALHATSLVVDSVYSWLLQHDAVLADPKAFKMAHDAHTTLWNLYQYLGSKKS